MKKRIDFVTNSSSSSFIVAYKDFNIDEDTIKKYPFLLAYKNFIMDNIIYGHDDYGETTTGEVFDSIEKLPEYFVDMYGYDNQTFDELYKNDGYVKETYDKCVDMLNKGYKILFKEIGYCDDRAEFFKQAQSDNFIIIDCQS